jgi:hypothetical protein
VDFITDPNKTEPLFFLLFTTNSGWEEPDGTCQTNLKIALGTLRDLNLQFTQTARHKYQMFGSEAKTPLVHHYSPQEGYISSKNYGLYHKEKFFWPAWQPAEPSNFSPLSGIFLTELGSASWLRTEGGGGFVKPELISAVKTLAVYNGAFNQILKSKAFSNFPNFKNKSALTLFFELLRTLLKREQLGLRDSFNLTPMGQVYIILYELLLITLFRAAMGCFKHEDGYWSPYGCSGSLLDSVFCSTTGIHPYKLGKCSGRIYEGNKLIRDPRDPPHPLAVIQPQSLEDWDKSQAWRFR